MKTFKLIDFYMQAILALVSVFTILFGNTVSYTIYIVQAAWQAISIISHTLNQQFLTSYRERKRYQFFAIGIVAVIILLHLFKTDILALRIINYAAPIIFFYYLHLCYREVFVYMKRPLSVLK